jgi:hypothetical protein
VLGATARAGMLQLSEIGEYFSWKDWILEEQPTKKLPGLQ